MILNRKFLCELQKRLKVGNHRGVHLNAIPAKSRYKFDFTRLSQIGESLPKNFIQALLSELPLKFRMSWKERVPDLNLLTEDEQYKLVNITTAFNNLINQTEAIESEKGINTFGFGFPLLVRRDQLDNKLTVAPILIWSLKIRRTRELNTWEVCRAEDDPIYINEVLINHLAIDAKIQVPPIPSEMLEDGLISDEELIEVCFNFIKAINSTIDPDMKNILRRKLDNIIAIKDRNQYEKLISNSSNAIIDFGGLFSIFEVQTQNIIQDYDTYSELNELTIDLENQPLHEFQPISCIETDPSQQCILNSLETTRNILIQGPPGTGKSQTLTAILINALENAKRTIVVCEKRTALEVLHNALIAKGVGNNCILIRDIIKDRRNVVDSVRGRIDHSLPKNNAYHYTKDPLNNLLAKVNNIICRINSKHKHLDKKILGQKVWSDIVGEFLSAKRNIPKQTEIRFDEIPFKFTQSELIEIVEELRKGELLYTEYKKCLKFSFINEIKFIGTNPFVIEKNLKSDFEIYAKKIAALKVKEITVSQEYLTLRSKILTTHCEILSKIIDSIDEVFVECENLEEVLDESKYRKFLNICFSLFSKRMMVIKTQQNLRGLFADLANCISKSEFNFSIRTANTLKENYNNLKMLKSELSNIRFEIPFKVASEINDISFINYSKKDFDNIILTELKDEFAELSTKIMKDAWFKFEIDLTSLKKLYFSFESICDKWNKYFCANQDFFPLEFAWHKFYRELSSTNLRIVNKLLEKRKWVEIFIPNYLNNLLINNADFELQTDDDPHTVLAALLKDVEKEQLKYIQQLWSSKQIDITKAFEKKNVNFSVENLFNKKSGSKFKRNSLRQIVQFDPTLFTTFFPIILTSPDVCSNLFRGKRNFFDLVIFDEASQLRLEDNFPALLKGKQIIVAGDEHQMPPSNYFSKIFDGTVENEDDIEEGELIIDKDDQLLSCESLLEFAVELNFKKEYLDFHYRSKHPYLIEFSNFAFYDQRLKPLPNSHDYIPIKYIQANGIFSDYTNEKEADLVLSILENDIKIGIGGTYPSVGIATFNITQRDLITTRLNEIKLNPKLGEFSSKIHELEKNGLFIKNLENIQGEERDIIIISTTYGTNKAGEFFQRFGPINHSKGYKLLNVIITRAKFMIFVCSSIPESTFLNYKQTLLIEGANNRKAVFYAYLAYCKAVSENNNELRLAVLTALSENRFNTSNSNLINNSLESPFEEEVYQILVNHFDENRLIPQYPFAGFRIDIVYDSKKIGVPKIAIECDGAKYHSSREAYLYDRHRQKILESHGFVFHRIWSTNWWRNDKMEAEKLINFIRKTETQH